MSALFRVGDAFSASAWKRIRWIAIASDTTTEIVKDRIPSVAAGITFFALLAMFPGLASIVSLYGMFADRASIAHILDALAPYVPDGAISVLGTELHRLIVQKPEKLNLAFLGGLAIATWSASGGLKALVDGLNVAYETDEQRSFLKLSAVAFALTLAGIVFGTAIVSLAVVLPIAVENSEFLRLVLGPFTYLRLPVVFLFCCLMLDFIYAYVPDRKNAGWLFLSWGSIVASALWIVATLIFTWYVQNFGNYDRVYGNLGAAVGFLTWIWILLLILLAGAELNCEIGRGPGGSARRS